MLIPLSLLLLAADTPPKPRTAPLPEVARLTLENNALRFELLKRQITELQQANESAVADICKSAGFGKCAIDAEKKVVTEVVEAKK